LTKKGKEKGGKYTDGIITGEKGGTRFREEYEMEIGKKGVSSHGSEKILGGDTWSPLGRKRRTVTTAEPAHQVYGGLRFKLLKRRVIVPGKNGKTKPEESKRDQKDVVKCVTKTSPYPGRDDKVGYFWKDSEEKKRRGRIGAVGGESKRRLLDHREEGKEIWRE